MRTPFRPVHRARRRCTWFAWAWLCLLATPAGAAPSAVVSELRWQGVEAVPTASLEASILTSRPSWKPWVKARPFEEPVLEADLERIVAFYRARGWYEARVRSELDWNRSRSRVAVRIEVDEGKPVRLERLEIELGPHPALSAEARDAVTGELPLMTGKVFDVDDYREAKRLLLERLAERSFPGARVQGGAEVDVPRRAASVAWQVETGPRVRLGPVEVVGLERVERPLVMRELHFSPDDPYSPSALEESRRQILGLQLFRTVRLEARRPEPSSETPEPSEPADPALEAVWPVEVRVEERPPRSVRAGIGFGTEDGVRVQLGWRHRNLFGGARSFAMEARYSLLLASLDATLLQPRWLHPDVELELAATARRETTPAYDASLLQTGVTVRRDFGPHWSGRVGWRYELISAVDPSGIFTDLPESSRLSFLQFGVRRSTVDDRLDPKRGTWLDLSLEPSFVALGSDLDYTRLVAEGRAYQPLGPTVLAARVRLGTLEPWGGSGTEDVPIVKRFFSGGSTSVRGFEYQKLGPLGSDDDPLGGLTLAEGSLELRFPIWKRLGGVAFGDAGQVALSPSRLRQDDFFFSAGAGLRFATPLGPLRLDVAAPLNPPDGASGLRVHFSVGQAF